MILYVNNENEIKDVDKTSNPSLIPLEINDGENPFEGWSTAKICCYKVTAHDGIITSMTPYIDSTIVEIVDKLGKQIEEIKAAVQSNE